jgi:hypothetical protein
LSFAGVSFLEWMSDRLCIWEGARSALLRALFLDPLLKLIDEEIEASRKR